MAAENSAARWSALGALALLPLYGCGDAPETTPDRESRDPVAPGQPAGAATARPTDEGPPRFRARQEVEVGGRAIGVTVADLDRDARPDLVVTLESPGTVLSFLSSRGGLAAAPARTAVGDYPLPAQVVHGSAGGLLLVAARTTGSVRTIDAGGNTTADVALGVTPRAIHSGDLGGDGQTEIVVASSGGQIDVLRGTGERTTFAVPDERTTCLHVAEDGATVWVGTQLPAGLRAYRSADLLGGAGAVEPLAQIELPGIPRALVETDVDGDGDSELVCAGGDRSLWILGTGAAGDSTTWAAGAPLDCEAPGLVPVALAAADLDGDDRRELLTIQFYDSGYGAVGTFAADRGRFAVSLSEYAGQAPVDLAVADFDGDGVRDLAIANSAAQRVSLLPGTGIAKRDKDAFYQARRAVVGTNPLAVAAGDLDGDGAPEAIVANGSDESLSVLRNEYSLLGTRVDVPVGPSPTEVLILDVDGDGANDAVTLIRPAEGASLRVLFGDGTGRLDDRGLAPIGLGGDAADLTSADLDGDGAVELICADPLGARLIVVDPPRPFPADWQPQPTILPIDGAPSAACAVRREGAPDALAVAIGGARARLAVLASDGSQLVTLTEAPATGDPVDIASGDIDGDGRADLAWLARLAPGENQGFVRVYSQGANGFAPGPELPAGLAAAEIVVGDLTGDGRADVAVAAQNTHNVNVWLATADGALQRWPDLGAGLGCLGLELTDLNLDGRLDIVVANAFSHDLSAIYNLPR